MENTLKGNSMEWDCWFMYDNHCFAKIDLSKSSNELFTQVRELFDEDHYGCIFMHSSPNSPSLREFELRAEYTKDVLISNVEIYNWIRKVKKAMKDSYDYCV
jgi:hypothetical protein